MGLFDTDLTPIDIFYEDLRGRPDNNQAREAINSMWLQYEPFADSNFRTEFTRDFRSRFWEMYLACGLLNMGFSLVPRKLLGKEGPDICIESQGKPRTWVEAVAPGAGEGMNELSYVDMPDVFTIPADALTLRLSGAIWTKWNDYLSYLGNNLVSPSEPYIIAAYGGKFPYGLGDDFPYIISALFPISPHETITFNWDNGELLDRQYQYRPNIAKPSGPVSTDVFSSKEYSRISAVIYSEVKYWTLRPGLNHALTIIHNPLAANPLPRGWLPQALSYWVEGGILQKSW